MDHGAGGHPDTAGSAHHHANWNPRDIKWQ
jgi:hypothetical protein